MFHLAAHPESEALVFSGDSADHRHRSDAERFTKLDGFFFNLLSQLTSRSQNNSVRPLIGVFDPATQSRPL